MTPGRTLLIVAILATFTSCTVSAKKLTKQSEASMLALIAALRNTFIELADIQESLGDKMTQEGVTLPPTTTPLMTTVNQTANETIETSSNATNATTKAAEATTKATEATSKATGTTIKATEATSEGTGAATEATRASIETTETTTEATNQATGTTIEVTGATTEAKEATIGAQATSTTIPPKSARLHTIPPFRSHPGRMYTNPGTHDGRCYCEEISEDEISDDRNDSSRGRHDDDSRGHQGGRDSAEKSSGGGSGSRDKGNGTRDQTGGGGSKNGDQKGSGDRSGGGGSATRTDGGGSDNKGGSGGDEPCFPSIQNLAVYEFAVNTLMDVSANPCGAQWTLIPTSDETEGRPVVDSECAVNKDVAELFAVKPSGLSIASATTQAGTHNVSTSGLYLAECNSNGKRAGAKFIVVRSGPDCECLINSSSPVVQLTCSVDYADSAIHPIYAIMTWYINGKYYGTDKPYRNMDDLIVYTATSVVEISNTIVNDYKCELTFGEPENTQYPFIAGNRPYFSASCSSSCEQE